MTNPERTQGEAVEPAKESSIARKVRGQAFAASIVVGSTLVGLMLGLGVEKLSSASPGIWFGEARNSEAATTGTPDFVNLARRLQPVVVNVSSTTKEEGPKQSPPSPEEEAMNQFLEKYFDAPAPSPRTPPEALGSGFIIGSDGTILTNYHVVENADKIIVRLSDKRQFEGKLIGKDPRTDIALLKIDAKNYLPTAALGDSDRLQVGEWVMAVGNPFGLDNSVTSGIVSAKGRHIGAGPYDDFIQTDASVNPGNSGGPLVNVRGEVVGINVAIVSQTGGNIGIGFATPVNLVKDLIPQLRAQGKVTRGWLGVAVQEVPSKLAIELGWEKPRGALVTATAEAGPAEKAGIKVGDIITEFDGKQVNEVGDFPLLVARTPIDKKVSVKVQREKGALSLSAMIAELKEEVSSASKQP